MFYVSCAEIKTYKIIVDLITPKNQGLLDVNVKQIAGAEAKIPGEAGGIPVLGENKCNISLESLELRNGIVVRKPEHGNAIEISTENGDGILIVAKGEGKSSIYTTGTEPSHIF